MAQESVTFDVTKGPSKANLQTALFHGNTREQITVNFFVKATKETTAKSHLENHLRFATLVLDTQIRGADRVGDSGEVWDLRGIMYLDGDKVAFSGRYSSQYRTGTFTLTLEGVTK